MMTPSDGFQPQSSVVTPSNVERLSRLSVMTGVSHVGEQDKAVSADQLVSKKRRNMFFVACFAFALIVGSIVAVTVSGSSSADAAVTSAQKDVDGIHADIDASKRLGPDFISKEDSSKVPVDTPVPSVGNSTTGDEQMDESGNVLPIVTDAPSTDAPTTNAPSTDAPSTNAPSTDPPVDHTPPSQPPPRSHGPCSLPSNYQELNMEFVPGNTNGWAMPGRCEPGRHCVYMCKPGYVRTHLGYTNDECPPVAGQCSDVYHYKSSRHGLYCDHGGNIQIPNNEPVCEPVPSYITIVSRLGQSVTGCPTVYPGSEDILSAKYTVHPHGRMPLTLFPAHYWHGVSRHYYVGTPGMSPEDTCQWDSLPRTAYIWGGHLENKHGQVWHAANFDFAETFRGHWGSPGYAMIVNKCPDGRPCHKYCEIKRKVEHGRIINYSAKYNSHGHRVSESHGAHSHCYVYGPVSQMRLEVELVPYH